MRPHLSKALNFSKVQNQGPNFAAWAPLLHVLVMGESLKRFLVSDKGPEIDPYLNLLAVQNCSKKSLTTRPL